MSSQEQSVTRATRTISWTVSDGQSGYGEGPTPEAAYHDFRERLYAEADAARQRIHEYEASLAYLAAPLPPQ